MIMLNVTHIIQSGGLILLGLFIFAEVGLFLGFFLPGDTLVITAGIFAKQGKLNIAAVILVAAIAAIAGDSTSYYLGRKFGRGLFKKEDSVFFDPKHVAKAEKFYDKYGPKTLLVAHFIPVVRTFTPLLAGVSKMHYPKFLKFNAAGDIFWAVSVALIGYYIGSKIPNIDNYILGVLLFVVFASSAPTIYHIVKAQLKHNALKKKSETPAPKKKD